MKISPPISDTSDLQIHLESISDDELREVLTEVDSDSLEYILNERGDLDNNPEIPDFDSVSDAVETVLEQFDVVDVILELKKRVDVLPSDFPKKYSKNGIPLF